MKKMIFIVTMISAVMITSCKKTDVDSEFNQQPLQELKHSSNPIPLSGSFSGLLSTVPGDCPDGWLGRQFIGSGEVSHLGNAECELNYCVKLEYPSPDPGIDGIFNGPGILTAANGDQLNGYFTGTLTLVWDGATILGANIEADGVFIGGTGRLEDAYGFVHSTGYLDYASGGGLYGQDIPTTLDFSGTIQYGAQLLDVTVDEGIASYLGACTPGNHYSMEGPGTGTLGDVDVAMDYCGTTTFIQLLQLNPPITIPIGGTNEGTAIMTDGGGNEVVSEFTGLYRFTYQPFLPLTTNLHNDFIVTGDITGGSGDFAGVSGKFLSFGTQDIPFSGGNAQFPAPGNFRVIGYFDD